MARILVLRISAIGDVAMTIPVIYSAARSNPAHTFTVVTQAFLKPLFIHPPANVEVIGINTRGREHKLSGLLRFAAVLARQRYDQVLDLHDVLRTRIIRTFFRMKGIPVFIFDKNRKGRSALTSRDGKVMRPLRPVIDRYIDVFRQAGLAYEETFVSLFRDHPADIAAMEATVGTKQGKWIGIAPFARHPGKIYPIERTEQIVESLARQEGNTVFLFGGRGEEEIILAHWASVYPNVISVVGRYPLDTELALISRLDVLFSMDSANMHFASLVGTPVVSVWGATHPYAGFYGWKQDAGHCIQAALPCRPCSVFGDKPCFRGDWACMVQIKPETVLGKIQKILNADGSSD